jgi:uncharacterized repeat protein (TIGR01451 family)
VPGLLLALVLTALAIGPAPSLATTTPVCTSNQQQGVLCLTLGDTPDPVAYSSFDGNATFLSYRAVVTNASRSSNLSHVGLSEALPAGTTFVRATSSKGTCSASGQTVACAIGALSGGQSATVDVVVTAPTTANPNPPDVTITNVATASFDERFSDQPNGGKQDTAVNSETTTVSKVAGQTFVPAGESGKVDTDPSQTQYGNTSIPNASTDVLATIDLLAPDTFCVNGQVKIGKKAYVCRNGGFVDVSVVNANTSALYSNAQNPLVFHLRWNSSLTSSKQTVKNFVVFYRPDGSTSVQVISTRCNAGATNLPCLRNISPIAGGGWSVDFVNAHNGRMR